MPVEHSLDTCACKHARPCPINDGEHRWSGWPGAICLNCFDEDPMEICLADCKCTCHEEFWRSYAEYWEKLKKKPLDLL